MPNRQDVVNAARSFLGTRWKHQGRSRDGTDCVGLVIAVGGELGLMPPDLWLPAYNRHPDPSMLGYFDKYMEPTQASKPKDGTVLVFSYMGSPYHAGIVVNARSQAIVHAFATKKKVTTDYMDNNQKGRKIIAAYDYRGLDYG